MKIQNCWDCKFHLGGRSCTKRPVEHSILWLSDNNCLDYEEKGEDKK